MNNKNNNKNNILKYFNKFLGKQTKQIYTKKFKLYSKNNVVKNNNKKYYRRKKIVYTHIMCIILENYLKNKIFKFLFTSELLTIFVKHIYLNVFTYIKKAKKYAEEEKNKQQIILNIYVEFAIFIIKQQKIKKTTTNNKVTQTKQNERIKAKSTILLC